MALLLFLAVPASNAILKVGGFHRLHQQKSLHKPNITKSFGKSKALKQKQRTASERQHFQTKLLN